MESLSHGYPDLIAEVQELSRLKAERDVWRDRCREAEEKYRSLADAVRAGALGYLDMVDEFDSDPVVRPVGGVAAAS